MDIAAFADLFKSYCQNYKYQEAIGKPVHGLHFIHYDMEDMTNALPNIKLPALFLTTPEVDMNGPNCDGLIENYESSFMVLLQLPGKDISQKGAILNQAKQITDQFIRRLINDSGFGVDILEGFNAAGIKEGPVNRTVDYLYGWSVSFNIEQGFDGEIQPDVWEDLAP